jgi:hypothetical protein
MPNGDTRNIARDIVIQGARVFSQGEPVRIETVDPNPQQPEYRNVVFSSAAGKWFQLRDEDFEGGVPAPAVPQHFAPGDAFQQGVITPGAQYAQPLQPGATQHSYKPKTVVREMKGNERGLILFSIATGAFGFLVLVGTFLPWVSLFGAQGGSGWQMMLHGTGGGFSIIIRGEGVVFFTGIWSILVGLAVMTGAVLLYTRRTLGGWIACIAGTVGVFCALISSITLMTNGLTAAVGLWLFSLFSCAASVSGGLTMKRFR